MRLFLGKATPVQLQFLVWGFVLLLNFFTYVPGEGFGQAVAYAPLNTLFYAIIIYGNISCIFPRLYQRGKTGGYIIAAASGIIAIAFLRAWLSYIIYNRFFALKPEVFNWKEIFYFLASSLFIYLMSFVFRIALEYFRVKRQAEQMLEQKSLAELNLLKSQVQPHFLFNTLNNIYYEAFREAPRTALLIGRLSDIMRYFVDESPKEKVALAAEIKFLENYIALEEIRIRHGVKVSFEQEYQGSPLIPPMLLMTFVENIFKHGIDRSASGNAFSVKLRQENTWLSFSTCNSLPAETPPVSHAGFGLINLEKRLILLYGNRFELRTTHTGSAFQAFLKIPLQ
ncbi:MAG TPA: sensor histidine kinase [Puia sp.]|nr:sensor histidine kinase [Puia sp.]